MANRKIKAAVVHLADVDNRSRRIPGNGRNGGVVEQVVRRAVVEVDDDTDRAVEEREIGADVLRAVLFPLQVRVAQ